MPDGVESKDLKKLRLGIVENAYSRIQQNTPFRLPGNPADTNVCIAGVCDVYRTQGADLKTDKSIHIKNPKQGEGSDIIQFNPYFEQNAEKLGFSKQEITDPSRLKDIVEPGDVVQYYGPHGGANNETRTYHARIAMGKSKSGEIQYFDNWKMLQPGKRGYVETGQESAAVIPDLEKGGKVIIYKPTEQMVEQIRKTNPALFQSDERKLTKLNKDVAEWYNVDREIKRQDDFANYKSKNQIPESFNSIAKVEISKLDEGFHKMTMKDGSIKKIPKKEYEDAFYDPKKWYALLDRVAKS
jgi:hypothetical protein